MKTIYYCKFPYDLIRNNSKSGLLLRKNKKFKSKLSDVKVLESCIDRRSNLNIVYNVMVTAFDHDFIKNMIKLWADYHGLKEPVIMNDLEFQNYINKTN